jgi:hypothetical protein
MDRPDAATESRMPAEASVMLKIAGVAEGVIAILVVFFWCVFQRTPSATILLKLLPEK